MRSTPGDSEAPVTPSAASRGQNPAAQGPRWISARSIRNGPRTLITVLVRRSTWRRRGAAAGARRRPAAGVRGVRVDPLLDGARRDPQRLAAGRPLNRLEVPLRDGVGAYERGDLRDDFRRDGRLEPPFSAAS